MRRVSHPQHRMGKTGSCVMYRPVLKYVHIHFEVKCFCCVAMRVKGGKVGAKDGWRNAFKNWSKARVHSGARSDSSVTPWAQKDNMSVCVVKSTRVISLHVQHVKHRQIVSLI